jgi:ABC-type dipeptide/oligopeptide/nickel transport system ATPase component
MTAASTDTGRDLAVRDLRVAFAGGRREVLHGVSLAARRGGRLGVVGESGSGKSLTILSVLRLLPDGARVTGGEIRFGGRDLLSLDEAAMARIRGKEIGVVFQNAAAALNPVVRIGTQVADVLRVHTGAGAREAWRRAVSLLGQTGLPDPEQQARAYPHELSGGMAQRALIALALAPSPRLLLADEPTTGLDVTIQAQVLDLLAGRVREAGTTLVLITHDLNVVRATCDEVAVMHRGRVVERGPLERVLASPVHPYTQGLLACAAPATGRGPLPFIDADTPMPEGEPLRLVGADHYAAVA